MNNFKIGDLYYGMRFRYKGSDITPPDNLTVLHVNHTGCTFKKVVCVSDDGCSHNYTIKHINDMEYLGRRTEPVILGLCRYDEDFMTNAQKALCQHLVSHPFVGESPEYLYILGGDSVIERVDRGRIKIIEQTPDPYKIIDGFRYILDKDGDQ
ncbi:hypothetical protein KAT92_05245 [Candidatus Babeliales bacterium]|nr:hypothetical protein [Candidatus Babeliales bacterium]